MAMYTRDWLASFQDSLVEIRKQHPVFMSDIFTHRKRVQADAHFMEHVDKQFGRLIVRSKDVERVMQRGGRYDQKEDACGPSVPFSQPIELEHSR
jgi:hypothetical protein